MRRSYTPSSVRFVAMSGAIDIENENATSSKAAPLNPAKPQDAVRRKRRAIGAVVVIGALTLLGVAIAGFLSLQHRSRPRRLVKLRLFWIRHGLSCANVMDKCSKGPDHEEELLPKVEAALQLVPGYSSARLNKTFGLKAATAIEGDCSVEVIAPGLVPGKIGGNGAIIRVHDLYTDPALTDCSRQQSKEAGRSFLKWLAEKQIKIHFSGSSFLLRAFQTSYGMLREPCMNTPGLDCDTIFEGNQALLTPVPYMTERAPEGFTSFELDNTPQTHDEQTRMIEKTYGKKGKHIGMNDTFANSWPRYSQQYEKLKALLAVVIAPAVGVIESWGTPPIQEFRSALESSLPERMHPKDHGREPVKVSWKGGQYETGSDFDKSEYTALDAPELNFAIVGHNQMMSEYCLAPDFQPKPENNAILEKLFILEIPEDQSAFQSITMRELRGKCALVMNAPRKAESWRDLATSDVGNCVSPLRVSDFLDLSKASGPTACVQAAPETAFPILSAFL